MDRIGSYHLKPFSTFRQNMTLITHEGWKKHSIHAMIEIDVTDARQRIQNHYEKTKEKISFTGWIIKCVAEAISAQKELNILRKGKKQLIYFEDIDIAVPVERIINNEPVPMAYILRKVQDKTVEEITAEIRSVQHQELNGKKQVLGDQFSPLERFAFSAPNILKRFLLWVVNHRPLLKKKHMGIIGVTAVGMKGNFPGWIIPLGGTTTMLFVIGGIRKKPGVMNDSICIRDYLHVTIAVDHDLIDGGPLARFVDRFTHLCESGFSLQKQPST